MSFRTMGEFQQALGELVAKTNGRRRKKRKKQARRNMALVYDGVHFDTVEELIKYRNQMAAEKAAPEWQLQTPGRGKSKRKRSGKAPRSLAGASLEAIFKQQARQIVRAAGGISSLGVAEGSKLDAALAQLGITTETAAQILLAFEEAGIPTDLDKTLRPLDPQAKKAREIVFAHQVARSNRARPNGAQVNWTAYPQYAYDAFWRNNPGRPPRARPNGHDAVIAKFVPDPLVQNAGPYTPHIYPYGVGGIPGCYAVKNGVSEVERHRAAKEGKTLSGGPSWPVHDRKHALLALQYMSAGFGGEKWRSKYPAMIRKLAKVWPLEDDRNRAIWTSYRQKREQIARYAPNLPSLAQLRGVA